MRDGTQAADQASGPLGGVDWAHVLVPETPLLEILVRGTIAYLVLSMLLRVVLRRQAGALGITDLLVVVLVADAAQNAMADNYNSVPDGLFLVAVIVGWAWLLDAASYRFRWLERLLRPRPLPLVENR